jgi:hypothetical protein
MREDNMEASDSSEERASAKALSHPRRETWRKLQRETAPKFLDWLDDGRRNTDLLHIQHNLTEFIIRHLSTKEDCEDFVLRWSSVLGRCNDPATYDDWFNILAYAHIHSLERYRRFYAVLTELYKIGQLPMKRWAIRILDVGTGPAPCLYALQDFYEQVTRFAEARQESRLKLETPRTDCVEQSREMARFLHYFSEASRRPGPFFVRFSDFLALDLQKFRQVSEQRSRESEHDSDDDDHWSPFPFQPEDFKYELYIFSNFLTDLKFVEEATTALAKLFFWLGPHQSVLVLGATGGSYQKIYAKLADLAAKAKVDTIGELPETIPCSLEDFGAHLVKSHYVTVLRHMRSIHPKLSKPDDIESSSDLWDPCSSLEGPKKFSVRLFKRKRLLRKRWGRMAAQSAAGPQNFTD